jgi:mRNA-degrading endonuclease RelE of RelBE toxin-antitoxin system
MSFLWTKKSKKASETEQQAREKLLQELSEDTLDQIKGGAALKVGCHVAEA